MSGAGGSPYRPDEYWSRAGALEGDDPLRAVLQLDVPLWMNRIVDKLQRNALEQVMPMLAARAPTVELGCGVGRWLHAIEDLRGGPVGVDLSPTMLRRARESQAGRLIRADAARLPFREGVAGSVLSVTVLQHLHYPEQEAALREARRITQPGGLLCFLERTGSRGAWHVFPRAVDDWISVARDAGWALRQHRGVEFLLPLRWVRALARALRVRSRAQSSPMAFRDDVRKYSLARTAYWTVVRAASAVSLVLEPTASRVLPPQAATHGLFLFTTRSGH
jgi:SAM-dependent methyltransferase